MTTTPLYANNWYDTPRTYELRQEVQNLYFRELAFAAYFGPTTIHRGETVSGELLFPAASTVGIGGGMSDESLEGTWVCLGFAQGVDEVDSINRRTTLWMRVPDGG